MRKHMYVLYPKAPRLTRRINRIHFPLMSFTLLSGDALEITHVRRRAEWGTKNGKVINPGQFSSTLVILDEDHQVLDVLELDETNLNRVAFQISRLQTEFKNY